MDRLMEILQYGSPKELREEILAMDTDKDKSRMFEDAKIGDPVRDSTGRNGVILEVLDREATLIPVMVSFSDGGHGCFSLDGKGWRGGTNIVPRVVPLNRMSRGEKAPQVGGMSSFPSPSSLKERIKGSERKFDGLPRISILARGEVSTPDIRYGGNICWIPFAYHLLPVEGLAKIAAVMRIGEIAGRPDDGWRKVPTMEHINHAISHLMSYVAGRHKDHHLANAACRVLMALDMDDKEPLPMASDSPKEVPEERSGTEGPTLM